jgi:hypothetical protein
VQEIPFFEMGRFPLLFSLFLSIAACSAQQIITPHTLAITPRYIDRDCSPPSCDTALQFLARHHNSSDANSNSSSQPIEEPTYSSVSLASSHDHVYRDHHVIKHSHPHASVKHLVKDARCFREGGKCMDMGKCFQLGGRTVKNLHHFCGGPVARQCCFSIGANTQHLGPADTVAEAKA